MNRAEFDKGTCFRNIRYLMERQNIKIGQIERKAGVRLGYMSRLEKEDNSAEPRIAFITTAAKMLGVSLDELIYGDASLLTGAEGKIYKFLQAIIDDTYRQVVEWRKRAIGREKALYFEGDNRLINSYICYLPNTSRKVCVSKYVELTKNVVEPKEFYEVTLENSQDESQATLVCNTAVMTPSILESVEKIYLLAEKDKGRFHISDFALQLIEEYCESKVMRDEHENDERERSKDGQ